MPTKKELNRKRRHNKIRQKIYGTAKRPRLAVKRSHLYTYAQIIDDEAGKTIISSSNKKDTKKGTKTEKAKNVGLDIAKKALDKKIKTVVFDRNGYKYHGRIKALAEGAREGGLKF